MRPPGNDPSFPALHGRPARGWVNDPNGLCRIDGRYHVFFQYNPHAPHHEAICWGHASSADLLTWTQEAIALRPRPGALDAFGCWSGCVVDDRGVPTAVYTAVADTPGDAVVALAHSDRSLTTWTQGERVVVPAPQDPAVSEARDPYVFVFGGHRYAIQGAGHPSGRPQIPLYGCDDLAQWVPLGPLLTADDPVAARVAPANIWECPNLVQVDGQWVLIVSMWREADGTHLLAGVRYLLGELRPAGAGLTFRATSGGSLDHGPTFYAPQCLVEPGRVLLWAWAAEHGRRRADIVEAGWAGVLTFPRELYLTDPAGSETTLASRPAAELVGLRRRQLDRCPATLEEPAFEILTEAPLRLLLTGGQEDELVAEVASPGRILVDGSLVEVFAGPVPTTTRAYPSPDRRWRLDGDLSRVTIHVLG